MSATTPLPKRDASASDAPGLRSLNVIAAAAKGGVPQARIRRVLADVAESLKPLHAQGGVHGGIAMSTIGLDASGKAHLLIPPLTPAADAESAARIDGYAAFEQYTDDPDSPCGPWTDIYALSAVAHTMLVGEAPPSALERCVKDESAPLAGRDLGAYDPEFLQAVDRGLSMRPSARPASIEAFARAFGLEPAVSAVAPAAATVAAQTQAPEPAAATPAHQAAPAVQAQSETQMPLSPAEATEASAALPPVAPAVTGGAKSGPRVPLLVLLGVLAAIALAVYMWLRPEGLLSASNGSKPAPSAGTEPPPTETKPEPPIPTPPALSDLGRNARPSEGTEGTAPGASPAATPDPSAATDSGASPTAGTASSAGGQTGAVNSGSSVSAVGTASTSAAATPGGAIAPRVLSNPGSVVSPGAASGTETAPNTQAPTNTGASVAGAGTGPGATPDGASTSIPPASPAPGASPDAANASTVTDDNQALSQDIDAAAQAKAAAEAKAAADAKAAEQAKTTAAQVAVRVSVRPWGEVIIDGRSRGISPPLGQVMLAPGRHQVTIRNPASSDYQTTINVTAGGSAGISHVFE
ncbi:PEGA domain-containing protein [Bordetella genomosp. 4]|uniref:Protein kinase domain-containing protein n=1 Tax=Bordetella genomosp. 4 TaxID=463044 RepID=A0A261TMR8_9BORD|nr:PEGA domain-containing protein [Bordetella genomosp. 4]OZI50591.1 hypothetical protein CAL20_22360 [Bordetella genomosp. 4]